MGILSRFYIAKIVLIFCLLAPMLGSGQIRLWQMYQTAGTGDSILFSSPDGQSIRKIHKDDIVLSSNNLVDSVTQLTDTSFTVYSALLGNNIITINVNNATGTDNQVIDTFFVLSDVLYLSLESDGEAAKTVDLSGYLDNTDDQIADTFDLVSNTIRLSLEDDGVGYYSIDLTPYINTDDQVADTFFINGNTLYLSLENDGEAAKTVDLSSYVNTDDQTADTFFLVGDSLYLSLEDDGEAASLVNLAPYANTDDQTLSLASDILTIEDGNTVDLSGYLDNTDDQYVDIFTIDGSNNLKISLENNASIISVDLTPYLDNTDDQTVDTFFIVGDLLYISLEDDDEAAITVDLSPYLNNVSLTETEIAFGGVGDVVYSEDEFHYDEGNGVLTIEDVSDPGFILDEGGEGSNYLELVNTGDGIGKIVHNRLSGNANVDISGSPNDGTGAGYVRLGRNTNTTGVSGLQVLRGDGTADVNHAFYNNSPSFIDRDIDGVSFSSNLTPTRDVDFFGTVHFRDSVFDENDESGTSGQILSSTATGVDWIDVADGSSTNEAWTLDGDAGSTTLVTSQTILFEGAGINSTNVSGDTLTITGTEVDGSVTNEAWTIWDDDVDNELITNQAVIFDGLGIVNTEYDSTVNTMFITASEVDGSTTNEVWTADGDDADQTVVSNQVFTFEGSGITTTDIEGDTLIINSVEVDGSTTNEAWIIDADAGIPTLITTQVVDFQGSTGISTDWNYSLNNLTITNTDPDQDETNELQDVDIFDIVDDSLRISLTEDADVYKVDLSGLTGSTPTLTETEVAFGGVGDVIDSESEFTYDESSGVLLIEDAGSPKLKVDAGGDGTSYFEFVDNNDVQGVIRKYSSGTSNALIDFSPIPEDTTKTAKVRLGRNTNTTGDVGLDIHDGDNTSAVQHRLINNGVSFLDQNGYGVSFSSSSTPSQDVDFFGDTRFRQGLFDKDDSDGDANDVLTSTGTKVDWQDIYGLIDTTNTLVTVNNAALWTLKSPDIYRDSDIAVGDFAGSAINGHVHIKGDGSGDPHLIFDAAPNNDSQRGILWDHGGLNNWRQRTDEDGPAKMYFEFDPTDSFSSYVPPLLTLDGNLAKIIIGESNGQDGYLDADFYADTDNLRPDSLDQYTEVYFTSDGVMRNKAVGTLPIEEKTATYTLGTDDFTTIVDASSGAVTVNLPGGSQAARKAVHGKIYTIVVEDATNEITIDPDVGGSINGASFHYINHEGAIQFQAFFTGVLLQWHIVSYWNQHTGIRHYTRSGATITLDAQQHTDLTFVVDLDGESAETNIQLSNTVDGGRYKVHIYNGSNTDVDLDTYTWYEVDRSTNVEASTGSINEIMLNIYRDGSAFYTDYQ